MFCFPPEGGSNGERLQTPPSVQTHMPPGFQTLLEDAFPPRPGCAAVSRRAEPWGGQGRGSRSGARSSSQGKRPEINSTRSHMRVTDTPVCPAALRQLTQLRIMKRQQQQQQQRFGIISRRDGVRCTLVLKSSGNNGGVGVAAAGRGNGTSLLPRNQLPRGLGASHSTPVSPRPREPHCGAASRGAPS